MATTGSGSSTRKKASTTRKDAAGKTSAGKTSAGKDPAKKSGGTRKTAAKKSGGSSQRAEAPRAASRPAQSPARVAASAASELVELTGKRLEGITGIERTDDGWTVQAEVVEVHRIPDTTDVLALYEITADERGDLQGYRRVTRYVRGTPGDE